MDKLKTALRLIQERVESKRAEGSVPTFLGLAGMIALVHKEIVDFSKDSENQTQYVINLGAMAVYALSTILPEAEDFTNELPDDETDETQDYPAKAPELMVSPDDEPGMDDPRWTRVAPGRSVSDVKHEPQEETDGEDDEP